MIGSILLTALRKGGNMFFSKIQLDDLSFLCNVRNAYAKEFLHDSRTFTLNEVISWFNTTNPDFWIIWINDERIGYFRLSNWSKENHNIYIGADIHPNFTGKGLGFSSYKKFMKFLFSKESPYNLNKITLEVLATNSRAHHLYKKLGFVEEGRKREEVLKDDTYIDSIIMSILKKDFN
jgi:RimJ/RimL family protein N-acetyltransferase